MGNAKRVELYRIGIILVTSLALIGIALFIVNHEFFQQAMGDEIFGQNYQFFLIVVIGGSISWLFTQYAQEQEVKKSKKDLQREFQKNLINAYNSAKRIRRLLRAKAMSAQNEEVTINKSQYIELMANLIDVQLQFEYLKKEVEITDLFSNISNLKGLYSQLSSIEKYLHDILEEYEQCYSKFGNKETCPLCELPLLAEFVYNAKQHRQNEIPDKFDNNFKSPADNVMDQLLSIIING